MEVVNLRKKVAEIGINNNNKVQAYHSGIASAIPQLEKLFLVKQRGIAQKQHLLMYSRKCIQAEEKDTKN